MRLVVHVLLQPDREYIGDFEESTFPEIGEEFENYYIVNDKKFINGMCEIYLKRNHANVAKKMDRTRCSYEAD